MKTYSITIEPGVIPRYVVRYGSELIGSHSSRAAAEAMRDSSERARASSVGDDFFVGYIECLYFTDTGEDGQPDENAELSESARLECLQACSKFQRDNATLLAQAYARGYDKAQAGRDFYFTRNHCGVGFWDCEVLKAGDLGERLTDAAHAAGEVSIYVGDDDLIYVE